MKKIATVTGTAALTLALLTGCGSNDKRDVEGVKSMDPDYIEVYNNTDGRPNVVLLCLRGVGFASTTREYAALMPIEDWNEFCKTKMKSRSVQDDQRGENGNGPQ